jgi:hypothetical protein
MQVAGTEIAAQARELGPDEREGTWRELVAANPRLAAAQQKAGRTLPVVVLAPQIRATANR